MRVINYFDTLRYKRENRQLKVENAALREHISLLEIKLNQFNNTYRNLNDLYKMALDENKTLRKQEADINQNV